MLRDVLARQLQLLIKQSASTAYNYAYCGPDELSLDFIRGETMKFSSTDHKRPKKIEITRPRRFVKYLPFGKIRGYANFSVPWFDGTTSEKESLDSYLDTVTLESGFKHSNQFHVTCFLSRVPITKLFIDCFLFISLLRGRGRIIDARKGTDGDARRCLHLVYET